MSAKGQKWSKKKKAITGGVAALLVVAALGANAAAMASRDAASDALGVTTGAAETGNITQSVSGSGSLTADKATNVLVPADLVVEQVLVKEGDTVEEGTPIAKVSAASVREKQLAIEENIDSLQKQRDDLGSDTEHYDLKKQVLQEQIDDLKADRDRMNALQDTLTLVSDTAGVVGKVNLYENTKTGQASLKEQGTTPQETDTKKQDAPSTGNVASITQTSATPAQEAPIATAGYGARSASPAAAEKLASQFGPTAVVPATPQAERAVAGSAPSRVGQRIALPVTTTAYSDSVPAASTSTGSQAVLPAVAMASTSAVPAATAHAFTVDQAVGKEGELDQQDATGSDSQPKRDAGSEATTPDTGDGGKTGGGGAPQPQAPPASGTDNGSGGTTPPTPDNPAAPTQLHGKFELNIAPPATGAVPQAELVLGDDAPYTAEVTWAPEADVFAPQTQYTCTVRLTAKDGYCFTPDASKLDVSVPNSTDGAFEPLDLDDDGIAETLKVTAVFPATAAAQESPSPDNSELPADAGAIDLGGYDMGGSYGLGSGDSSSLTQPGSSYSDTEAIAITVTPNDKMFLDIKVDELDILKVTTDQQAEVKLDALGDETFTGTILKIDDGTGDAAANAGEGATVKYTVRIEVPRDDRMRYGMTGKAEIVVAEAKDVVLVPIDAVSDIDGQSVVYTSVDDKGTLDSPVNVTTGVSDGTNVEVTEGLSAGDAICYVPAVEGDDEQLYY